MTKLSQETEDVVGRCPICGEKPYRTVSGLYRCDGLTVWNGGTGNKLHDEWIARASLRTAHRDI